MLDVNVAENQAELLSPVQKEVRLPIVLWVLVHFSETIPIQVQHVFTLDHYVKTNGFAYCDLYHAWTLEFATHNHHLDLRHIQAFCILSPDEVGHLH